MTDQSFSERHGFAPPPEVLPFDQVPGAVRDAFANALTQFAKDRRAELLPVFFHKDLYLRLGPFIWKVVNKPPLNPYGGPWHYYIPALFRQCQWWQFYDICEEVYRLVAETYGLPDAEVFGQEVNSLFAREGVVWRFAAEGRIERVYPPIVSGKLEQARILLQDERFRGADEQFERALGHLSSRPDPNTESCVTEAVGAVEAVARIICGDHNARLSRILDKEPFNSAIHPTLREAIAKIYAYRGDAAAHGQVGPSKVGVEEAEWVLTMAAATIVYLVSKFGMHTQ